MRRKFVVIWLLVLSAIVGFAMVHHPPLSAQDSGSGVPPLLLYEKVPLSNHLGRIDHMDGNGNMIFFSFLGGNGVGVENWYDGKEVAFIPGVPEAQGELYAPGYNELFSASTQGKLYIFDATTYKLKKTIDFGTDADDELWDPVHKVVLLGFGEAGGGIAEIDPATNQQVGKVLKTGAHPERFQIELHGPMLYVNCPDAGMVVEAINRDSGAIQKWPLHGVINNFTLALDEADHRLFTITRRIPAMVVFDTQTGQEVARVTGVPGKADDAFFDAARKRIYIIGGQGFISVVQEVTPDRYSLIANIPSKVGARTGYWDAALDRLYVPVQAEGNEPPELLTYDAED